MSDELFTAIVPDADGTYYWRKSQLTPCRVVEIEDGYLYMHGREEMYDQDGGLFGPRIPSPEQCAELWRNLERKGVVDDN